MSPDKEHPVIPDLKLEQFLLGELEQEEMSRIERELESDEILQGRLAELERSNQEILDRYPADQMASAIHEKSGQPVPVKSVKRRQGFNLWPVPALSAAAAAIVILLILPPPWQWFGGQPEIPVGTRIKGLEPQLLLFRKTGDGSEQLESGATAREHDLILIQYIAAGRTHGAIFSVDGRGALTRHAPVKSSEPLQLEQEGAVSLDFSYELDDAPRWEKFYFVTSDSLFDLEAVFAAAQDSIGGSPLDSLSLPHHVHQSIFTLEKEASHE